MEFCCRAGGAKQFACGPRTMIKHLSTPPSPPCGRPATRMFASAGQQTFQPAAPDSAYPHRFPFRTGAGTPTKKCFTFKAEISMKTKETVTKCPVSNRHLCTKVGHFRQTDAHSTDKISLGEDKVPRFGLISRLAAGGRHATIERRPEGPPKKILKNAESSG